MRTAGKELGQLRISVSLISGTAEASSCVNQGVAKISYWLEALAERAPPFSLIDRLFLALTIAHPSSAEGGGRGRGRFDKAGRCFFARAALTYEPWLSPDWTVRMAGAGDAMQRALAAVHKTRITENERKTASDIISAA